MHKIIVTILLLSLCILLAGSYIIILDVSKTYETGENKAQRKLVASNLIAREKQDQTADFFIFVVLDDAGEYIEDVTKFEKFSGTYTIAIIPRLSNSRAIADYLFARDIPYIVHLPMQPLGYENPGKHVISEDLNPDQLLATIAYNFSDFSNYIGFNNHMGSKASTNEHVIDSILAYLQGKDIIVLDSKTNVQSVLGKRAQKWGFTSVVRDVFIDNINDKQYIKKQIQKGIDVAKEQGHAILIGHVHRSETLPALIEMYDEVRKQDGTFLSLEHFQQSHRAH